MEAMAKHCILLFSVLLLLPGCAVNLHGSQSGGAGASTVTTGSSLQATAGAGQARVGASFGSSPPAGAPGGQIGFSRGAAAVLIVGLVIAEAAEFLAAQFRGPSAPLRQPASASIADTCSCYGWKPPVEPVE
jgi:hypothetical protein